jgi:hypothetical protein
MYIVKKCVLCGMPSGKFRVKLNEEDICNYCSYFEKNRDTILNINGRKPLLQNRFEKVKGKYKYDAAVGLSGGKDSTYVLYKLVKEYKLKVLAITYDNGFLTDYARKSIARTIKTLKVDHMYYKPNMEVLGKFYKAAVKSYGDPCIACALGGYFLSFKVCSELWIPFFVHGRSPYQMYRNYFEGSGDVFLPIMELNMHQHSFISIYKVYNIIHQKLKCYISSITDNEKDADEIVNEFFINPEKISEDFIPEFLAFFLFNEYSEERIKDVLESSIGWNNRKNFKSLGHYDCAIHNAACYAYKEIHGVSDLVPDLAVMIRFGDLNIQNAEKILTSNKLMYENVNISLRQLSKLCKLSENDIRRYINSLKNSNKEKFESL